MMIGWIRGLIGQRQSRAELRRLAEGLEAEVERLRAELGHLRLLCRCLRDVNQDLDRRLLEVER